MNCLTFKSFLQIVTHQELLPYNIIINDYVPFKYNDFLLSLFSSFLLYNI